MSPSAEEVKSAARRAQLAESKTIQSVVARLLGQDPKEVTNWTPLGEHRRAIIEELDQTLGKTIPASLIPNIKDVVDLTAAYRDNCS